MDSFILAMALEIQGWFFANAADGAQMLGDALLFGWIDGTRADGTDGDAAHAGNAAVGIGGLDMLRIDGAIWAGFGAFAAVYAIAGGLRHVATAWSFLVRTVAGNIWHAVVVARAFFCNAFGNAAQSGDVGFVWTTRGVLAHDGMLGEGADGGDDAKSASYGKIGELDKLIIEIAVAINGDDDGACAISADVREALSGEHGNAAAKTRHGDDDKVISGERDLLVIGETICQIDVERIWIKCARENISDCFCATGWAEGDGFDVHALCPLFVLFDLFCHPADVVEGVFWNAHAGKRRVGEMSAQAEGLGGEMEVADANAEIDLTQPHLLLTEAGFVGFVEMEMIAAFDNAPRLAVGG